MLPHWYHACYPAAHVQHPTGSADRCPDSLLSVNLYRWTPDSSLPLLPAQLHVVLVKNVAEGVDEVRIHLLLLAGAGALHIQTLEPVHILRQSRRQVTNGMCFQTSWRWLLSAN
jgi:hypothetical protein